MLLKIVLVGVLGVLNLAVLISATVLSKTKPDMSIFLFFGVFFGMFIGGEIMEMKCIDNWFEKKGIQWVIKCNQSFNNIFLKYKEKIFLLKNFHFRI